MVMIMVETGEGTQLTQQKRTEKALAFFFEIISTFQRKTVSVCSTNTRYGTRYLLHYLLALLPGGIEQGQPACTGGQLPKLLVTFDKYLAAICHRPPLDHVSIS